VICAPLPTGTHYRRLGETEWHTVGEPPTRIASEEHNVNDKEDDMIDDDIHDYAPPDAYASALAARAATSKQTPEPDTPLFNSAHLGD
jgi:hypothetical protein